MSLGVRHVTRRRKKARKERGFPTRTSVLKDAVEILIYPIAFLAPLALVPQVWQLYATQDATSLALSTWLVLGFLNLLWIFYAWVHRERPVMITNVMFGFLNFAIAFGVILFR